MFAGFYYWAPEVDRRDVQRDARQDPLLGLADLLQRHLLPDALPRAWPACRAATPTTRCSSPTSTRSRRSARFGFGLAQVYFFFFVVLPMMRGKGEPAPQKPWEGAEGLEWEVPSPAPFHTFETPPKLERRGDPGDRLSAWQRRMTPEQTQEQPAAGADPGVDRGGVLRRLRRQDRAVRRLRRHVGSTSRAHARATTARMVGKLAVVAALMFGFGYALVPMYRAHLQRARHQHAVARPSCRAPAPCERRPTRRSTRSRTITVEFDANARGPWDFKPAQRSMQVHPGELATVMYEFRNVQNRTMAAQAIPSYAPQAGDGALQQARVLLLQPSTRWSRARAKQWPVVFVIDPKLPKDVTTITLSLHLLRGRRQGAGRAAGRKPRRAATEPRS